MSAKIIVLVLSCFVPFCATAQSVESPRVPDGLPGESADDVPAAPDLNDKCSGKARKLISVNPATEQRAIIYTGCQIENMAEQVKAGWNALTKQDQALLRQIEAAAELLEEADAYAEELDAELIGVTASKQSLLAAIDAKTVSRREVKQHNDKVNDAAGKCFQYMGRIERMFTTLIELEQKTAFMQPDAQAALLGASTEIIAALEETRVALSATWGKLQGLQVHD